MLHTGSREPHDVTASSFSQDEPIAPVRELCGSVSQILSPTAWQSSAPEVAAPSQTPVDAAVFGS